VSMVVLFAVLLTRQSPVTDVTVVPATLARAAGAISVGACVAAVLSAAVLSSEFRPPAAEAPAISVRLIGLELMNRHGAALLIVGILLTVALIGAVVIASGEPKQKPGDPT